MSDRIGELLDANNRYLDEARAARRKLAILASIMPDAEYVLSPAWVDHFRQWNIATFGPGTRTRGTLDHLRKEMREIEAKPDDPDEWCDIILLGLNGLIRLGLDGRQALERLKAKQARNEERRWPDWRSADPDKAIEHVKREDAK